MLENVYKDGMIEFKEGLKTVARVFIYPNEVYVKMLSDGYDFQCDSVDTAKQLINLRMGI